MFHLLSLICIDQRRLTTNISETNTNISETYGTVNQSGLLVSYKKIPDLPSGNTDYFPTPTYEHTVDTQLKPRGDLLDNNYLRIRD